MTRTIWLYGVAAVLVGFAAGYALATGDLALAGISAFTAVVCLRWLRDEVHDLMARALRPPTRHLHVIDEGRLP